MTPKSLIHRFQREKEPVVRDRMEYGLSPLQREINRLFDDFLDGFGTFPALRQMETGLMRFSPRVDVVETEKEFKVTAELPGMEEKDIEVALEEGALTIRGEKKEEKEHKEGGVVHTERSYGSFHRMIALPSSIKPDTAKATFTKGVLKIALEKKEESTPSHKTIKINAE